MNRSDVFSTDAKALGKMLDTGEVPSWGSEDLAAMLEHQLDAPLEVDLGGLDLALAARLPHLTGTGDRPLRTFRDLFCHPRPPVDLLELAKRFAKLHRNQPESPLPEELSTLIYLLTIIIARAKCGQQISGLDMETLHFGVDWALGRPWLDTTTRALLAEGWKTIQAEGSQDC